MSLISEIGGHCSLRLRGLPTGAGKRIAPANQGIKPSFGPQRGFFQGHSMQENFRQFLDRLRQAGELVDLHQPVDIRHIATLVDQARTALYFHKVIGYEMPVVSGLIRSRERAIMSLGCETYREIEDKLTAAIAKPIPPRHVKTSPTREVVMVGEDVDLYKLPIPMSSIYDGGPMITAGIVIARDPELGINSGIYRFIVKEKALTGIDIVTPNNMRLFAQRAFERKEP